MVRSPGIDWERVVGLASAQFVLPAFAAALQRSRPERITGSGTGRVPEAVHAANLERNAELRDELAAAVGVLNRADIEPVLLKGAIRLLDGLYPDHGWRMLRDLDLLVPKASLAEAIRALEEAGYARVARARRSGASEGVCQIDLHTRVVCDAETGCGSYKRVDVLDRARPVALGDGRVGIPCGRASGGAPDRPQPDPAPRPCFRAYHLRDRLEAAALVAVGARSIDWQAVSAAFVAAGYRRPLLSFLLSERWRGGARSRWSRTGPDLLTALQQRRIALQARSATSRVHRLAGSAGGSPRSGASSRRPTKASTGRSATSGG